MSNPFHAGDKVRFINEAVEGIVVRIFSDSEVEVQDENSFKYRVKVFEIVPLLNAGEMREEQDLHSPEENSSEIKRESFGKYFGNFQSCFLCIMPENFETLLHSPYSIVLVNATENILLYSLHMTEKAEEISSFGIVNPHEEIFVLTLAANAQLSSVNCQLKYIIHSGKSNSENNMGSLEFSFTPEDFLNEKLFLSHDLFLKHILAFDINAKDEMKIPEGEITKLVDHFTAGEKNITKAERLERKKNYYTTTLLTNEKTVDLHIEELTDDYTGMSNSEMLHLQLAHFHKELDNARVHHYYRIIFIHGKGNGTLKNSIRKELDAMNLKYHDADTAKFGFGATEVML